MALFERLGAFKTWAKETGTSRAVLARDKRLDEPLSLGITTDHLVLKNVATYGIPGPVTTAAYDPVQSLLAIGTKNGCIKIFGKGLACALWIEKSAPIKYLMFQSGYPVLAAVDSRNILTVFDLEKQRISSALAIRGYVTSVEMVPGADWLFLGLADGTIDVFDLRVGKLAPYRIPELMTEWRQFQAEERKKQGLEGPAKPRHPKVELVSAIQFHSTDLNQLLIAYETAVILWNVREKAAVHVFEFGRNNGEKLRVTAMSWRPTGESQFVVGYDDGLLCLWDADSEDQPIAWRYIFQENHKNQDRTVLNEPIYRLAWCSSADFSETYLVITGGTHPTDNHGVNILTYNKDSTFRDPVRQSILPVPAEVSDFVILPWSSPYFLGTNDPLGILILTTKGDILAFSLQQSYAEYMLPSAFSFTSPRLERFYQHINFDDQLHKALITPPLNTVRQPYLPLTGGIAGARHVYQLETTDIMITAHEGGIIRIWDSSFVALRPLPHLTLHTLDFIAQPQKSEITVFDLSDKNGLLAVAYASGVVLCFALSQKEQEEDNICTADTARDIKMTQQNIHNLDNLIQDLGGSGDDDHNVQPEKPQNPGSPQGETSIGDSNNPFIHDSTLSQTQPLQEDARIGEHLDSQSPKTQDEPPNCASPKATVSEPLEEEQLADKVGSSSIDGASRIEIHNRPNPPGRTYELDFTLHTRLNDIVALAQANGELLAVADKNGHICIVDTLTRTIVFDSTILIPSEDGHHDEPHQGDVTLTPIDANVNTLKFVQSYPASTDKVPALQLLIGTTDGSLHQIVFSKEDDMTWSVLESVRACGPLGSALVDVYVVDLNGKEQTPKHDTDMHMENSPVASEVGTESSINRSPPPSVEEQPETATDNDNAGFLKRSLSRKQSKSSKSSASSRRSKSVRETTENTKPSRTRLQKHPHFCIIVTEAGIRVHLNVSPLKLFSFSTSELSESQPDIRIINANIVHREGAVVLSCVLTNGMIAIFSLPHLELLGTCVAPFDNVRCAQIVQDGRLLISSDPLEVVQTGFLLQPNMRIEESIKLHDPNRQLPARPSVHTATGNKSWFASVTAGLQRESLTLQELDLLVGGRDRPLPRNNVKQKQPQATATTGPGNVFQELGNKVNERGERLNELDQKFKEVNQASGDFLKAIKDYNERQAQKKWWEF